MLQKIKVYTDGGSRGNPGLAGAGVYMEDQSGQEFYRELKFLGTKTNNEAEYLAFLMAIDYLMRFELKNPGLIKSVEFFLDSKLVVEQINRRWKIKKAELRQLADSSWKNLSALPYPISVNHLLREKNTIADQLANEAMDQAC
jgi:ribonuclease HI